MWVRSELCGLIVGPFVARGCGLMCALRRTELKPAPTTLFDESTKTLVLPSEMISPAAMALHKKPSAQSDLDWAWPRPINQLQMHPNLQSPI